MKLFTLLMMALVCVNVHAAEIDGRAVFGTSPGHDVDAALKRAGKESKHVLLFSFDPKEGGSDITSFMDLAETKKIVKDHFIVVVLTRGHKDLARYPSPGAPEKAYYALINANGKTAKTEMVYRNGDVGLKTVKGWLQLP